MPPQIPEVEPTTIVAGDTVQFTRVFGEFSALDGWALTYRLVGPLGSSTGALVDETVTGTPQGGGWLVAFAPAATANVKARGTYRLVGRVSLAADSHAVYDGVVQLEANPFTASPADQLTHAERMLTVIEAALEGRLTVDMEHYQIDGKLVGKIQTADLMRYRAKYRTEIWRARHRGSAGPSHVVRFGGAR